MILSEEGKVTYVGWKKARSYWELQMTEKGGSRIREAFIPRHYDCATNEEQVKAAHRAAVTRRAEFVPGLFHFYSSQFYWVCCGKYIIFVYLYCFWLRL